MKIELDLDSEQIYHLIDLLDMRAIDILMSSHRPDSEYNILSEQQKSEALVYDKDLADILRGGVDEN